MTEDTLQTELGSGSVARTPATYSRTGAEEQYMRLTAEVLTDMADTSEWPVYFDHCFQRITLDTVFSGEWYEYVEGRPAYQSVTDTQLLEAIDVALRMVRGGLETVDRLNAYSLWHRGKLDNSDEYETPQGWTQ